MKIYLKYLFIGSLIFFNACGGGSNDNQTSTQEIKTPMQVGTLYTMKKGQRVEKESDYTVIVLETDINSGITTVQLDSGSAAIYTP
jgi:hypothetical protein